MNFILYLEYSQANYVNSILQCQLHFQLKVLSPTGGYLVRLRNTVKVKVLVLQFPDTSYAQSHCPAT